MRWGHAALVFGMAAAVSASPGLRITSLQVAPTVAYPPDTGAGYSVSNHVSSEGVEVQLRLHGHHFATIVTNCAVMAVRPHPGVDRNGWGSTLYLQPFIAKAVLGHATIRSATVSPAGVLLDVSGLVSQGAVGSYGSWSITNLVLRYDPLGKRVTGGGTYRIGLDGPVAAAGGDLNLYKLASNYLDDVPLLDGTVGDTGDMTHADYTTDSTSDTWLPPLQPGHYPGPATDRLSITAHGDFCDVDTLAQSETNFRAIQAAYKPSLRVDLVAQAPGYGLIPGFGYQTSLSRIYLADNVGITPVITSGSTTTQFVYDVSIESWALPGDGTGMDVVLDATTAVATNWPSIEVYMEESLAVCRTNRLVGFIGHTGATNYHGSVEIPKRPGAGDNGGYLRLVAPYRSNSTPP